ncbi:MAG: response regulator [Proteobacteria bacterium]|nr:response regulator [Pseudomonadota bacterium]
MSKSISGVKPAAHRVLLYDGDVRVREGLAALLGRVGIEVELAGDRSQALAALARPGLGVAVVDVDTPGPDEGFALLRELQAGASDLCSIALLARPTFAAAAEALRCGAVDIVAKAPENVGYLTEAIRRLSRRPAPPREAPAEALRRALALQEELLRALIEASRASSPAEDGGERAPGAAAAGPRACVVLVVDDEPRTAEGLGLALGREGGFQVVSVVSGGEALDYVGQSKFDLALVKEGLPDLPSSIVARSLRAEADDGIVIRFTHPTASRPGRADIVEAERSIEFIPMLSSGDQLVEQLQALRTGLAAKQAERRYLERFRTLHGGLLQRYAEVRQELLGAVEDA